VGSKDHVGFLAIGFLFADDDGVSHLTDETIDVDTKVDLDEITVVQSEVFGDQGRNVANEMVGRHAGRESDTLFHLFVLSKDFLHFLFDEIITESAEGGNGGTGLAFQNHLF